MELQTDSVWPGALFWWYRSVPGLLMQQERLLILTVYDYFSFSVLARTLFQPWKRDVISTDNLSLEERLQVLGLNLMSRLIGATVRFGAMVAGAFCLVLAVSLSVFLWLSWLLAPIIAIGFIIGGLAIIGGGTQ